MTADEVALQAEEQNVIKLEEKAAWIKREFNAIDNAYIAWDCSFPVKIRGQTYATSGELEKAYEKKKVESEMAAQAAPDARQQYEEKRLQLI